MILKNMLLTMTFLWVINAYAVEKQYEKSTKEASCLIKKYAISSNEDIKKSILNNLSSLSDDNPDNINVIRMYSGVLSSRGEYKKAISVLEAFNQKHKNTSLLLHECMLKDRVGDYKPSCYKKVISLKRAGGVNDIDYLMALFMMDDKDFNKEKDIYMKKMNDNHDLEVFKNKKEKLLKVFYPN